MAKDAKYLKGIDVSRWQGPMHWRQARQAGNEYAWIKATEGTLWIDPRYLDNAEGADMAGLLWGPYHYFRNAYSWLEQAEHFVARVLEGPTPSLPPALDFEDTKTPANGALIRAFVESVETRLQLGRPLIYTGAWWWNDVRLGHCQTWAARYPLWIAHYNVQKPTIPKPWTTWAIWQWASMGDGPGHGASSAYIDRNRFRGTRAEMEGWTGQE